MGTDCDLYELERIEVEERLEDFVFALQVERFTFKPPATQPVTGTTGRRDRTRLG
jgi:hypothetical protein